MQTKTISQADALTLSQRTEDHFFDRLTSRLRCVHQLISAVTLTMLTVSAASAAEQKIVVYPEGVNTPVAVTLLRREGKVGRDSPFYDNYRPQVQFSAQREHVTCAVRVPQNIEKVEPGQTVEVALNCSEKFKVHQDEKEFLVFEGGRKVAVGKLK